MLAKTRGLWNNLQGLLSTTLEVALFHTKRLNMPLRILQGLRLRLMSKTNITCSIARYRVVVVSTRFNPLISNALILHPKTKMMIWILDRFEPIIKNPVRSPSKILLTLGNMQRDSIGRTRLQSCTGQTLLLCSKWTKELSVCGRQITLDNATRLSLARLWNI